MSDRSKVARENQVARVIFWERRWKILKKNSRKCFCHRPSERKKLTNPDDMLRPLITSLMALIKGYCGKSNVGTIWICEARGKVGRTRLVATSSQMCALTGTCEARGKVGRTRLLATTSQMCALTGTAVGPTFRMGTFELMRWTEGFCNGGVKGVASGLKTGSIASGLNTGWMLENLDF